MAVAGLDDTDDGKIDEVTVDVVGVWSDRGVKSGGGGGGANAPPVP